MAGPNRTLIVVAGAALVAGSPFLMDFLQKWESGKARVLVVYPDKLAGGLPTVCNGLTKHVTSTPIIVNERWTEERCEAEEQRAVIRMQERLAPCFKRAPNQMVWDMASSHGWNNGPAATCGSGAMAAWNRGEWARGCQRIARGDDGRVVWSFVRDGKNADGSPRFKFVQGLANRRADEAQTCGGAL